MATPLGFGYMACPSRLAYRAAHRLALRDMEVEVVISPSVGDWLDELNRRTTSAEAALPAEFARRR